MPTNLPPAIDALLSSGARRFTVPMDPQPPCEIFDDGTGRWYPSGIPWGGEDWFAPYPPGTVLPVREEWAVHYCVPLCSRGVVYKADYPRGIEDTHDFGLFQWNTAESMPPGIVRRHVVVTDCRPVRVEDQWCWDVSVEPKQ